MRRYQPPRRSESISSRAAHYEPDDIAMPRTERYADSDFVPALRYQVRHDAVNTHGCEKQADAGKCRKQPQLKPLEAERFNELVLHAVDIEYRLVLIHLLSRPL